VQVDIKDKQFSETWAIILGGSSGFGLASIEKLVRHGMNIAVLYRETAAEEKLLKEKFSNLATASGVTILPFNINALDAAGRNLFIEKFTASVGKKNNVRLLLHSIARGNLKPLMVMQDTESKNNNETLSIEDIQLTTYAMSTSLLDWARLLIKEELFHQNARIIGLTSEGANKFWEGYAAVSIAKASLQSLTTYMAIELGKYGLRTNLIQAGITETPSMKKISSSKKLIEMSIARNPLGRMTRTEDVANVIYLLCTDEASWINGAVIHADGGEHCL
jgi:NAD(P)-dependent dehydrogenase (short-subunit alcohol dehydrogenase family)